MDRLTAAPEHCFWGFLDPALEPVITVDDGTELTIEAVTHHSGDTPDLLMDDGIRRSGKDRQARPGPGVHIMTGPIAVAGAEPGDTLVVAIHEMRAAAAPRLQLRRELGAALRHDGQGAHHDLRAGGRPRRQVPRARSTGLRLRLHAPTYATPGVALPAGVRRPRAVRPQVAVPVRPHFGVMGVAPGVRRAVTAGIPPGVWGGNVDNWRLGAGCDDALPRVRGTSGLYFGDPHFAQGDGEICGTAIEASLDARIEISIARDVPITSPVLETSTHWFTHGFGADLDEAMRMAALQMLGPAAAALRPFAQTTPTRWRQSRLTSASPRSSTPRSGCHAAIREVDLLS